MTMNRVSPFEDLADFEPKKPEQPKPVERAQLDSVAETNGFPSRPAVKPPAKLRRRRYTTGRNKQINIKATDETIARLNRIADERHLPLGAVLEMALDALDKPQ